MTLAQHIHNHQEKPGFTIRLGSGYVIEVHGYYLYLVHNGDSARVGIVDDYGRLVVFRDWYKRLTTELGALPSDLFEDA